MIKEFPIKEILNAVNSISKIEKKKTKILEKKALSHNKDVLNLNNLVKSKNKSEILVLNQIIE